MILRFQRLARRLHNLRLGALARCVDVLSRILFSAHLPGKTSIGKGVVFGHNGLGVIVNGRAVIGDNCFIGSHVVLGGQPMMDGAPRLEENVVVHSGAKVFGAITLGAGSVIAANSVVTKHVPAGVMVAGAPAVIKKRDVDHRRYRPNAWKSDA